MKRDRDKNADDVADLAGIRLAVCSETTFGEAIDEAKVKQITGSSHLTAMRKFQNAFQFTATHTLWLDCNHKPYLTSCDTGMRRRVRLIPFDIEVPLSKVDPKLPAKLAAEASGVLNWLVEGIRLWQEEALEVPNCVQAATKDYMGESDPLGQFIEDCIETPEYWNLSEIRPTREVYDWYRDWADAQGIRQPWTQQSLTRKLCDREFEYSRSSQVRGFRRMQLVYRHDQLSGERTNPTMYNNRCEPFIR